jgi:hypothetical protein
MLYNVIYIYIYEFHDPNFGHSIVEL